MKVISLYKLLANGIIKQAAVDYQKLLCGEVEETKNCNIIECEKFFNSEYFTILTNIDGPTLMKELKAEAEAYKYNWKAIRKAHGEVEED